MYVISSIIRFIWRHAAFLSSTTDSCTRANGRRQMHLRARVRDRLESESWGSLANLVIWATPSIAGTGLNSIMPRNDPECSPPDLRRLRIPERHTSGAAVANRAGVAATEQPRYCAEREWRAVRESDDATCLCAPRLHNEADCVPQRLRYKCGTLPPQNPPQLRGVGSSE